MDGSGHFNLPLHENLRSSQYNLAALLPAPPIRSAHLPIADTGALPDFNGDPFLRQFRLVRRLGSGTFGEAYLVYNVGRPHVPLVLKIPCGVGEAAERNRAMLTAEAALLRELDHPSVVQFYDFAVAPPPSSQAYLVMEYAEGGSLRDWVRRRAQEAGGTRQQRLSDMEIARVIFCVIRALKFIHLAGVLHLDIKPDNVLLGGSGQPLLADFGLSRAAVDCGAAGGTRSYMAPEVLARNRSLDGRADVWSAGVLLHWLTVGTSEGVRAAEMGPSWALPLHHPTVHPALWALLARMLVVDPASRPSSRELMLTPEVAAVMYLAQEPSSAGVTAGIQDGLQVDPAHVPAHPVNSWTPTVYDDLPAHRYEGPYVRTGVAVATQGPSDSVSSPSLPGGGLASVPRDVPHTTMQPGNVSERPDSREGPLTGTGHRGPLDPPHETPLLRAFSIALRARHTSPDFARFKSLHGCSYDAVLVPAVPLRLRRRERPTTDATRMAVLQVANGSSELQTRSAGDSLFRVHVGVNMVYGATGCGKTWLMRRIAHCHATGLSHCDSGIAALDQFQRVVFLQLCDLPSDSGLMRYGATCTVAEGIARAVAEACDFATSRFDSEWWWSFKTMS